MSRTAITDHHQSGLLCLEDLQENGFISLLNWITVTALQNFKRRLFYTYIFVRSIIVFFSGKSNWELRSVLISPSHHHNCLNCPKHLTKRHHDFICHKVGSKLWNKRRKKGDPLTNQTVVDRIKKCLNDEYKKDLYWTHIDCVKTTFDSNIIGFI